MTKVMGIKESSVKEIKFSVEILFIISFSCPWNR